MTETQATQGYLQLGDGRIYYEEAGQGEPLVLAHAGFVDSRMWDDQWQAFVERYRVIRFDMRGFGRSDPASGPLVRREELRDVLRGLKLERATLVGCSLSGETCLDLALEHPQLVSALVLVSAVPSGFALQGEPPRYLMEMMGAAEQGDLERAAELQSRIWIDGPRREPGQVDQALRQRAAEMSRIALANDTFRRVDSQQPSPLSPPAVERLDSLKLPVLIVAGELDAPEILRAAELMAGAIPGARKVVMPSCAHMPNMEQPERFNQIVLGFLGGQG